MTATLIQRTASAYTYPLLIKNMFLAPVVDNPDQEIVYRDHLRYTYRDFRQRVHRLANALTAVGVKPGDTVAVMDWDSHRYLECFFAVPMLGAVLHTINVRLSPEQILYTIDHAEDDYLLINDEFLPVIEQIKGRIDTVKRYVLLTDLDNPPATAIPLAGEYEDLLSRADDHFDFEDFDENTRATTFYTTGTTGMPKGVYFSHRQLVLHTLGNLAAFGTATHQGRFHQQDVYLPLTPMFHVHAWGMPYVATSLGVKQVYPGKYAPGPILQLIAREGATFSHCVPTIMHMLINHPSFEEIDLSRWKVLIGGSALTKAMCQKVLNRGADIFTGYGMSETCPILTVAHVHRDDLESDEEVALRCKTGRPIPLVQLRLVDEQMNDIPKNGEEVGELVVRAPWLTQGYLKDQRNSENLWKGGYLHTGDVANINPENYVTITDRIKDVIKTGGEWLSSLELEDVIGLHPAVAEVAVIGMSDKKWGERPLALVVTKKDATPPTPRQLVSHINQFIEKGLLSKQAMLLKVRVVESIDKTSVGKIDKKTLRVKHLG
ncbi:AMP-dependent synthetase and ligase [Desulfobulbus propionicus DSM 2032]|uniref:AMP-dependent synthetase and ligase n=1 Tax=Desulfobulbus propionicus (strain ATCC 33891 / DSM 2032 / VKM B-1956 / 1pr3) TaxID=577650 RepID=A0A7U4DPU2_DESPD|nr:fatty acid--CoA ligase [Desulfobulbus propionicus]ADW18444.1 AMP-dependent synthetase and ligase [Desulfobulbus propionicus DSM 2032]